MEEGRKTQDESVNSYKLENHTISGACTMTSSVTTSEHISFFRHYKNVTHVMTALEIIFFWFRIVNAAFSLSMFCLTSGQLLQINLNQDETRFRCMKLNR